MQTFRGISSAAVLLLASMIPVMTGAQAERALKVAQPIKKARGPVQPPRPLPDCSFTDSEEATRHMQRVSQPADMTEVVVISCPLDDTRYPDQSYLLDIRYGSGEVLQKLVVQSPLSAEMFSASLLDATGDGYLDLIVSTDIAGGGPYVEFDLYVYDPEAKSFRRDPSFAGTSAPALARTKGCVVTEFRAGPGAYVATRSCFDTQSNQWRSVESCSVVPDDGCRKRLTR